MPRPIRIEYHNAFYHVMNRGSGRQNIFHGPKYFLSFLDCLAEANQKFGGIVHAYCLMSNHYHLILETPNANLSRIMRHINGVYTQRYNKLKSTDGPLFRGRFKAILIDEDTYLSGLNRYIHRNPIKLVKKLESYAWSSYPAYLGLMPSPKWLNKNQTLDILARDGDLKKYQFYVESNVDKDAGSVENFYTKSAIPTVMGGSDFKKKICHKISTSNSTHQDQIKHALNDHITSDKIIKAVAKTFKTEENLIIRRQIIRSKNNFPRKLAMYLCQIDAQNNLSEIQKTFNLKSVGAVSRILTSVRKDLENNKYIKEIREIRNIYMSYN